MIRTTIAIICLVVVLLAGCNLEEAQDQASSSTVPAADSPAPSSESASTPTKMGQVEIGESEGRAANADVIQVRAVLEENGTWTFHVTVSHPDTGWDDYANGWDVVTEAGEVLKASSSDAFTRLLLHPHETEQPFTRSQSKIVVPDGVTALIVRAHDLVDGYGGIEISVDLSTESGPGYVIERN
jgi:hypothetical protein